MSFSQRCIVPITFSNDNEISYCKLIAILLRSEKTTIKYTKLINTKHQNLNFFKTCAYRPITDYMTPQATSFRSLVSQTDKFTLRRFNVINSLFCPEIFFGCAVNPTTTPFSSQTKKLKFQLKMLKLRNQIHLKKGSTVWKNWRNFKTS